MDDNMDANIDANMDRAEQQNRYKALAETFTAKIASLTFENCRTVRWYKTYRIQQQSYWGGKSSRKSAAIALHAPQSDEQKGRWNGKYQNFELSYVANSIKTAVAETFCTSTPSASASASARFFEDIDLQDREIAIIWFNTPLLLLDVRALLPLLNISVEKIEGDNVDEITQKLADLLYQKFKNDCHGIVYSSRYSGNTLDCAAIWYLPKITGAKQVKLEDYFEGDVDIIDILTNQLHFVYI